MGTSVRTIWFYLSPWWKSEEKRFAWISFFVLIALSVLSVYIAVRMNVWQKRFFDALEKKDLDAFVQQLIFFVPLMTAMLAEFCTRNYMINWISFRWRRWVTQEMKKKWLSTKGYYRVPLETPELDNPDQRIAQDADTATLGILSMFLVFFKEGINFFTFSMMLWSLSQNLPLVIGRHHLMIPGFLLWSAIGYSLVGIWIIFKVGRPLIGLDREQEKREATFRYRLIRVVERREEIATFGGEFVEAQGLEQVFKTITQNYYAILKRHIYINLFQNFYLNTGHFLPIFIVGPTYFAGLITMGVLMQIRGMFTQVYDSASLIVFKFQQIASIAASIQRILAFHRLLEHGADQAASKVPRKSSYLQIQKLTLLSPKGDVIWQVPPFEIKPGEHKLLMAPSGRGKTTLLRVLKGIYPFYEGTFKRPEQMLFVPQRPYMPVGTLRQCVSYPSFSFEEELLRSLMADCGLAHLIPQLDEAADFQQILSLGEQQRVNFVRILAHQPKWLVLDEPTSQLNEGYRDALLRLLKERLPQSGMLIITHQTLSLFPDIIQETPSPLDDTAHAYSVS
jgi:vitamin B12/bleomycin/antimicrobial peptide transport system ATP-binding/permease protein